MGAMPLANLGPEDLLRLWEFLVTNYPQAFLAAGAISLAAFVGWILVPALESYGRVWEKVAAGFLSLYVLAALALVGTLIGLLVFYYSGDIIALP
jgi:hypothetical protein